MPDIHPSVLLQFASDAIDALRLDTEVGALEEQLRGLQETRAEWGESRPCVYPGCKANSIRRSHTIQDAALAKFFGSEPMTPKWSGEAAGFVVTASAVGGLSVFPGYCTADEKKFIFENRGWFEDKLDDALQLMRACHREIWQAENRRTFVDQLRTLLTDIDAADHRGRMRDSKMGASITAQANVLLDHSLLQSEMIVRLRPLAERLEADVIGERPIPAKGMHAVDLDRKPFSFHAAVKLDTESAPLLLIVLVPNGPRSRLLVAIEPDFEHELTAYVSHWLNQTEIDATLGAWIRSGTLDWYADPAWWNGLSETDRSSILAGINTI